MHEFPDKHKIILSQKRNCGIVVASAYSSGERTYVIEKMGKEEEEKCFMSIEKLDESSFSFLPSSLPLFLSLFFCQNYCFRNLQIPLLLFLLRAVLR